jgi:hypothetical protein
MVTDLPKSIRNQPRRGFYAINVSVATVTVILGLCGSGKSHFAERMVGVKLFDEGVLWGWPNWQPFCEALASGKDCAIVEAAFCFESNREVFLKKIREINPDTIVNWICLENNPVAADENCHNDSKRPKKHIEGNILQNDRVTKLYTYPEGAVILKIVGIPKKEPDSEA